MEKLIEELTKVNPANLSEEGLKLFNKINEIIDRNEELEKQVVLVPEGTTFLAIPKEMIPKSKVREIIQKYYDVYEKEKEYRYILDVEDEQKVLREIEQELLQEGDK